MTRRLLLGGLTTGVFAAVQEQGAWVRVVGNPILEAALSWEHNGLQEASVLYEGPGDWKMLARAAWTTTAAIEYFTSTDGITWTRPLALAVLGHGSGGEISGVDCHYPHYMKVGSAYWCYYVSGDPATGPYHRATASDGFTFALVPGMAITLPSGYTSWGNCYVWEEAGTFFGLFEAGSTAGSPTWAIFLYTSADGITWTIGNGGAALSTLQVAAGGAYGGPWMPAGQKVRGRYQLWYHAAPGAGDLPTDLYHASSDDLITWTKVTPGPLLEHDGGAFEVTQAADPCVLEVDGESWLFYSGVDQDTENASIGLARFAGPLTELC